MLAARLPPFRSTLRNFGLYGPPNAGIGTGGHSRLAILLRFCAMAASRNSSCAPLGPRNRKRRRFRMHLRCANSISTFLRSLRDCLYRRVLAIARATSLAGS
jgi:hypothetical protein